MYLYGLGDPRYKTWINAVNANMLWFIFMQYQYMPSSCLVELVYGIFRTFVLKLIKKNHFKDEGTFIQSMLQIGVSQSICYKSQQYCSTF